MNELIAAVVMNFMSAQTTKHNTKSLLRYNLYIYHYNNTILYTCYDVRWCSIIRHSTGYIYMMDAIHIRWCCRHIQQRKITRYRLYTILVYTHFISVMNFSYMDKMYRGKNLNMHRNFMYI